MAFRPHPVGKGGRNVAALRCECDFVFVRVYFFAGFYRSSGACGRLPGVTRPRRNRYAPHVHKLFLPLAERAFHFAGVILSLGGGALIVQLLPLQTPNLQLCSVFLEK